MSVNTSVTQLGNNTGRIEHYMTQPNFILFEIFVAAISVTTVITSGMVIDHIYRVQDQKSRANHMFVILSISDIGVGALSIPVCGTYWYYIIETEQDLPSFVSNSKVFFGDFPYYFSYFITFTIAVDRLLVIKFQNQYKEIITTGTLKIILSFVFAFTLVYSAVSTYLYSINKVMAILNLGRGYEIMLIVCCTALIAVYAYILLFVRGKSNANYLSKHGDNHFNEKLTRTVALIFICQVACVLPYFVFWQISSNISQRVTFKVMPWVNLMRYCQCFWNALILLHSQKSQEKRSPNSASSENIHHLVNETPLALLNKTQHHHSRNGLL